MTCTNVKKRRKTNESCESVSTNNENTILPINMDFYTSTNDDYMNLQFFLKIK